MDKETKQAIQEIKALSEHDEAIESSPEHCSTCNCGCGCHPCKHTDEKDKPYFPSNRT